MSEVEEMLAEALAKTMRGLPRKSLQLGIAFGDNYPEDDDLITYTNSIGFSERWIPLSKEPPCIECGKLMNCGGAKGRCSTCAERVTRVRRKGK